MKHWVFDLDGTLVDSIGPYFRNLKVLLPKFGANIEAVDWGLARKKFAREFLGLYIAEKHIDEAYKLLLQKSMDEVQEIDTFDGIHDMLTHIKSKNLMISIWTGREKESAQSIIQKTGLKKYCEHFVSGSCIIQNKPHPEGLLKILTDSKSHHNDVVMIGDSDFDILAAKSAKVKSVSVSWGHPDSEKLADISDHHFKTVADMKAWTLKLK